MYAYPQQNPILDHGISCRRDADTVRWDTHSQSSVLSRGRNEEGPVEVESQSQPWIAVAAVLTVVLQVFAHAPLWIIGCTLVAAVCVIASLLLARRSRAVVVTTLLISAGLLVPVGLGDLLALVMLATVIQVVATVVLPRRGAYLVVGTTAAAAAISLFLEQPDSALPVAIATLGLGCALVHVVAFSLREAENTHLQQISQQATRLVGPTRVELNRIKHELDLVTSLLRHEADSRQNAESQLLEAFRIKEAFLATMSHELRTPLHQIIGYSELLIEEAEDGDPTELAGDVTRIQEAAMNLFDIISNVLDQSQIESGTMTTDPVPIDLAEFVERLIQSFATQARTRGNTLRLRCPEDIGSVVSDSEKLQTILKNLLSNACKFTENGTIRLSLERDVEADEPTYVFSVSDTGIGIDPNEMERLFRPFEQADGSSTRRFDGAGLGLAVSRNLAAILGGTLTASSQLGEGSTFTLRLPARWSQMGDASLIVRSVAIDPRDLKLDSGLKSA